jgi:hypothetical protein
LAGYAALREENQEEDILKQCYCYTTLKASNFVSKYNVSKIYRITQYNGKWKDWKPVFEKQM